MNNTNNNLFAVSKRDQYTTVAELINESRPDKMFYAMLILSSIIISSGVILNNSPIIIGGMLVTPLLTQILLLALGLTTGQPSLVRRISIFIGKITLSIITGSIILGLLFATSSTIIPEVINNLQAAFLYFIVAAASGTAVTLAWVRKEVSEVLPGIAIAVSLVPPLAFAGVSISQGGIDQAVFFIIIYILNLIGIIMGSLVVFSMSGFGATDSIIQEEISHSNYSDPEPDAQETKNLNSNN